MGWKEEYFLNPNGAPAGQVFSDLTGAPPSAAPTVYDVPGTKLGNSNLWEMLYNTTGGKPQTPPTEEELLNKKRKEETEYYQKNAKGRAATYLTGPLGLLESPNLFRSLLGT